MGKAKQSRVHPYIPREASVVPAPSATSHPSLVLEDQIRRRAYELYAERGRADGQALDDWLRAEAEIRARKGGVAA